LQREETILPKSFIEYQPEASGRLAKRTTHWIIYKEFKLQQERAMASLVETVDTSQLLKQQK